MIISSPSPDKRGEAECDPGIERIKTSWPGQTRPDEGEAKSPGSSSRGSRTGDKEDGLNAELQGDREPAALVTMKKEVCGGSGQTRIT